MFYGNFFFIIQWFKNSDRRVVITFSVINESKVYVVCAILLQIKFNRSVENFRSMYCISNADIICLVKLKIKLFLKWLSCFCTITRIRLNIQHTVTLQ